MWKFFKDIWLDYHAAQAEMACMGIWCFPSAAGFWTYVDQETFVKYLESKKNEHT